jgi:hypothetical protein
MSDDTEFDNKVRALNDAFREDLVVAPEKKGKCYMTASVAALGQPFGLRALAAVALAKGDAFTPEIDPNGTHDMIRIVIDGVIIWAKIDYYDKADPDLGAEDPSDVATTERVMTLMLPEDY